MRSSVQLILFSPFRLGIFFQTSISPSHSILSFFGLVFHFFLSFRLSIFPGFQFFFSRIFSSQSIVSIFLRFVLFLLVSERRVEFFGFIFSPHFELVRVFFQLIYSYSPSPFGLESYKTVRLKPVLLPLRILFILKIGK